MNIKKVAIITYIGITGALLASTVLNKTPKTDIKPKKEYVLESIITGNIKPEVKKVTEEFEYNNLEIKAIKGNLPLEIETKNQLTVPKSLTNQELEKYNKLVNYALAKSKKEKVILINKSQCTIELLENKQVLKRYNIELGSNPLEDKLMEGDESTPEGKYYIDFRLSEGNSTFYKALHINYPNTEDKIEFKNNKKMGLIPKDAKIGGNIEIHGHGSGQKGNVEGQNWTFGCVALSNSDIDDVYDLVKVGTPVIIVRYTNIKY
jgi:murein L,D-transpeptidase YafK